MHHVIYVTSHLRKLYGHITGGCLSTGAAIHHWMWCAARPDNSCDRPHHSPSQKKTYDL
jgi:hypothetical protein